jgi:spore photoproduct lyase
VPIRQIFIDACVQDLPETDQIRRQINAPAQVIDDLHTVFDYINQADDGVQRGKETLLLTRNRGAFIRKCPGTSHYTCCDYQILHIGTFCTMDCAYCILQSYFHPPVLQYFVNHDEMLAQLHQMFAAPLARRFGTGEFTDSLIWELWSGFSHELISAFAAQKHALLELKTKTVNIGAFKHIHHNRKTIMSWSLNTPAVIARQERGTATLAQRLRAAARCQQWGYPLSFHFDPLVIYDNWRQDYHQTIEMIFKMIDPGNIVWISLGSFRFMPALKPMIAKRFPDSTLIYGEFISGMDGKLRYFKPLRIDLYRQIASWIRKWAPAVTLYFCMEDGHVWRESLGMVPEDVGGLPTLLDRSAILHCDLA